MTDEDVNKIGVLVDSKLDKSREGMKEDINSALKPVNDKLDALWDQTVRLTEGFEEIKESLKSQTTALNHTDDNLGKVDKRLNEVENHLGIVPPPELTIAG